jgi:DNA-binding Xre family transcriptional regulator
MVLTNLNRYDGIHTLRLNKLESNMDAKDQLIALSLIGDVMCGKPEAIMSILLSETQKLIMEYLEYQKKNYDRLGIPTGEPKDMLETLVSRCKLQVQIMIDEEEKILKANRKQNIRRIVQMRNQKHEAGSVSDISQKLGISKSEVRRLKKNGKLDEVLMSSQFRKI